MSRVGKNPIAVPQGVEVKIEKGRVSVKGPKGTLSRDLHPELRVELKDGEILVSRSSDSKFHKSLHGLYRSLVFNMVEGVTQAYERKLEIVGVGYKGEMKNNRLNLQLGYSHSIVFVPPDGIEIKAVSATNLSVTGIDKELVGQVAAKIRSFRPPEPYKGKGIKYAGEYIRRKAGKTAA
ncbi:MAG: 50S ribosomal protein L6 [bacterium]